MKNLKQASLLIFAVLSISLGAAAVTGFNVILPKDRSITWSTEIPIKVFSAKAKRIEINGTLADIDKAGEFSAMALLKPGKNLIISKATFPVGETLSVKTRVLRMVTCDDIELLSKSRKHSAKQQILNLLTLGIIENYPDNLFQPDKPITRGEFATWLARAKELNTFKQKMDEFYDIPKEHWRAPYIKAVIDKGYMRGLSKDKFGVDEKITRFDAIVAIAKAVGMEPLKLSKSPFADVKPGSEEAYLLFSAFNSGWISGFMAGKARMFGPDRGIARGDIAALLSKFSNIKKLNASMYDFDIGYSESRSSKISTRPAIVEITSEPFSIPADGKTPVKISVKIWDAQGASDVSLVWANLTPLGGPNNAKMNLMKDGKYEVSFVVTPETEAGKKDISIRALDRSGLKSPISTVKITILKQNK